MSQIYISFESKFSDLFYCYRVLKREKCKEGREKGAEGREKGVEGREKGAEGREKGGEGREKGERGREKGKNKKKREAVLLQICSLIRT